MILRHKCRAPHSIATLSVQQVFAEVAEFVAGLPEIGYERDAEKRFVRAQS